MDVRLGYRIKVAIQLILNSLFEYEKSLNALETGNHNGRPGDEQKAGHNNGQKSAKLHFAYLNRYIDWVNIKKDGANRFDARRDHLQFEFGSFSIMEWLTLLCVKIQGLNLTALEFIGRYCHPFKKGIRFLCLPLNEQ